jgi:hypothetical protein
MLTEGSDKNGRRKGKKKKNTIYRVLEVMIMNLELCNLPFLTNVLRCLAGETISR